jgi:hypothetical protein
MINKSPFPGMDPYLEGEMWQEFHSTFTHQLRSQLMSKLPPTYVALLEKYYIIDFSSIGISDSKTKQYIYPDVNVSTIREHSIPYQAFTPSTLELISPASNKKGVLTIEIRDVAERKLVTVIELLSPMNKIGSGFKAYVNKREAILQTKTHLVEIDLLRIGQRIPLIGGKLPLAPYYTFLSRATNRPNTEVWPIQLQEYLPTIPIPLSSEDDDIPLSLQQAIEACFQLVGYQKLLDYTQPPPSPVLNAPELNWVTEIVGKIKQ